MVQMWIIVSNIIHLLQNLLKKLVLDYLLGSNKETDKCVLAQKEILIDFLFPLSACHASRSEIK